MKRKAALVTGRSQPRRWRGSASAELGGRLPGHATKHRARGEAGTAGIVVEEQPTDDLPRCVQPADRSALVDTTSALSGVIRRPPKVNVMPQVTWKATYGASSRRLAQFDFRTASPRVPLPSFTDGSNGTSVITAALYSATWARNASGSTPSSLTASSSSVSACTLVTCRIRYSSRRRSTTLLSKTCHANCAGCARIRLPYLA